jgi:hypothetical protein
MKKSEAGSFAKGPNLLTVQTMQTVTVSVAKIPKHFQWAPASGGDTRAICIALLALSQQIAGFLAACPTLQRASVIPVSSHTPRSESPACRE